jgi:hypothetical protein
MLCPLRVVPAQNQAVHQSTFRVTKKIAGFASEVVERGEDGHHSRLPFSYHKKNLINSC